MKVDLSTQKTLVIVTCCKDMWSFEMLAKSMRKNLYPCKIKIIINEDDGYCGAWMYWYEKYIKFLLRPHSVMVYKRSEIYDFEIPYEHRYDGWVNQQVLKLMISYEVDTPYYVCLDSKNFFFRKTNIDNMKQTEQTTGWLHPWLIEWCKNVCKTLDVEFTGKDDFAVTQNITPFVLDTIWTKELVEIEPTKFDFFKLFFRLKLPVATCSPSEFIFYDIWCKKKNYVYDEYTIQNCATVWDHCLELDMELYEYVLEQYNHFGVTVTGLHGSLKGQLSKSQCVRLLNKIGCRSFMPTSIDYPF